MTFDKHLALKGDRADVARYSNMMVQAWPYSYTFRFRVGELPTYVLHVGAMGGQKLTIFGWRAYSASWLVAGHEGWLHEGEAMREVVALRLRPVMELLLQRP